MRLIWFDDDDRISAAVSVILSGGVCWIVQTYPIYKEPVAVFAGC